MKINESHESTDSCLRSRIGVSFEAHWDPEAKCPSCF